ncbi:hypothetical protein ACFE04_029646 [Oxalis oulophora]
MSRSEPRNPQFSLISQLSRGNNFMMRLRVCNVWESSMISKPNEPVKLNILFVDEEGNEIQASCPPKFSRWFRPILQVGQIVIVAKFSVEGNVRSYRYTSCSYSMKLSSTTVIKKYNGPSIAIPSFSYNFVLFETLSTESLSNELLIDVIGLIVAITYLDSNGQSTRPKPKKILRLKDVSGSEIDVVLWPPFDDKIDDATILHEVEMGRFIIAMKGLSVKSYNNELRLSTTAGTILAVNEAISIFQDYDDIFKPSPIVINDFRREDANAAIKVVEERTIGELLDMNPMWHVGEEFSCKVNVCGINNEKGWWYKACRSCKKSLSEHNELYCCDTCGITDTFTAKYKVALDVEDETGSTTFILFENSAIQLFKFPASKYRSGDDQHTVPIYMKKQVQNVKKAFHVSLAINDDRFGGGCSFIVRKVLDYDDANANSTISEVVGSKIKLLLSPSPSNLMQSSPSELEDDISLEKKSQSYVKRKYCVVDDEVDSESQTLKTKKVVDGGPSMN